MRSSLHEMSQSKSVWGEREKSRKVEKVCDVDGNQYSNKFGVLPLDSILHDFWAKGGGEALVLVKKLDMSIIRYLPCFNITRE